AALVAKVARTMDRCHALGLVHRDLKPANVLLDEQGEPRVADFGCVRDLSARSLTETGAVLGTPAYMAPEQLEGCRVDRRADVYALGVMLYELVTHVRPYGGDSYVEVGMAIARGAFRRPAELVPDVSLELEAVVLRAMARVAADRHSSAGALARDLDRLVSRARPAEKPPRPRRTALLLALAGGAFVLLGVAASVR